MRLFILSIVLMIEIAPMLENIVYINPRMYEVTSDEMTNMIQSTPRCLHAYKPIYLRRADMEFYLYSNSVAWLTLINDVRVGVSDNCNSNSNSNIPLSRHSATHKYFHFI